MTLQPRPAGRPSSIDEAEHRYLVPVPGSGATRTAISEGMVALLKEFYGIGPTQAKTYLHDDLVVCLLRGGFTRVEQTLLDGGRGHAVI